MSSGVVCVICRCMAYLLNRSIHKLICMDTVCEWVVASASSNLMFRKKWQSSLATEADSHCTPTACCWITLLRVCTVALVILSCYEYLQGTTVPPPPGHSDTHANTHSLSLYSFAFHRQCHTLPPPRKMTQLVSNLSCLARWALVHPWLAAVCHFLCVMCVLHLFFPASGKMLAISMKINTNHGTQHNLTIRQTCLWEWRH